MAVRASDGLLLGAAATELVGVDVAPNIVGLLLGAAVGVLDGTKVVGCAVGCEEG